MNIQRSYTKLKNSLSKGINSIYWEDKFKSFCIDMSEQKSDQTKCTKQAEIHRKITPFVD